MSPNDTENNFITVSIDELINRDLGQTGTPERDKFDAKIQAAAIAYQLKEKNKTI